MKQETAEPPAANRRAQRKMDQFREEYNHVRPHEALEMQTPAAIHPSPRIFPARLPEPEYPSTMLVRSVRPHGNFRWKKDDIFLKRSFGANASGCCPKTIKGSPSLRRNSGGPIRQQAVVRDACKDRLLQVDAGEGVPSPAPHPLTPEDKKVSGIKMKPSVRMLPVAHTRVTVRSHRNAGWECRLGSVTDHGASIDLYR